MSEDGQIDTCRTAYRDARDLASNIVSKNPQLPALPSAHSDFYIALQEIYEWVSRTPKPKTSMRSGLTQRQLAVIKLEEMEQDPTDKAINRMSRTIKN